MILNVEAVRKNTVYILQLDVMKRQIMQLIAISKLVQ